MNAPNGKIYVEECKSQKTENAGDFVCQIEEMIEQITKPAQKIKMNSMPKPTFSIKSS